MNMLDVGMPQLPGEKKGLEFREIVSMIWRRKWLIFIPLVASLVGGVLLCRFLPKMYTSMAYIHFGRPEYAVERPTRDAIVQHQTAFKERARKLEIEVTSESVLKPVFRKHRLIDPERPQSLLGRIKSFLFGLEALAYGEQYEEAKGNLLVEFREDQPVIKVEYTADNRVTARNVCDEVAGLLFEKDRESGKILEKQRDMYLSRFKAAEDKLREKKIEIKEMVARAQRKDQMPERLDFMSRQLGAFRQDIRSLGDKVSRDTSTYALYVLKFQSLRRTVEEPVLATQLDRDPRLGVLASEKLKDFEDYVQRLIETYGRYHYKVVAAQKMLKDLRRDAAIEEKKLENLPTRLPALREDRNRLEKEIAEKTEALRERQERSEEINDRIAEDATASEIEKLDEGELVKLQEELAEITEIEEPALRKERKNLQQALLKVQRELDELETLAKLSGYQMARGEEGADGESGVLGGGDAEDIVEENQQNEKIREILKKLFPTGVPRNLNPDWLDALVRLVSLEISIKRDNERIADLEKEKEDLEIKIRGAFATEVDLSGLRETEGDLAAEYERARERLERAEAQKALFERSRGLDPSGEGADVRRFDASLPLEHSSPEFTLIMLLTGVGGLVLGGALALVLEMADHTVKRPVDLLRVIDRPVLATIPSLDIGRFHTPENLFFRTKRVVEADLESGVLYDKSYVREIRHRSIATEQIRKLRLRMSTPEGERICTILVTSALAGEGKSTVAANLAVAISQMIGEYVLLIDGDLRRPDLHNFFGLPPKPGLSEYLESDLDLSHLLVKTDFDKLTLLQAGRAPANSTELLGSEKMRHLIREVKSRYPDRYVVVDSPPVLSTSEPNVLASQVDGVVLVVRAGMTPREMVEDVLLSLNPDKVIGVVMNDVRRGAGRYYTPTYA